MKKMLLSAITLAVLLPSSAMAGTNDGEFVDDLGKSLKGISGFFSDGVEAIVDAAKRASANGNDRNALQQIDKNLEKHGEKHHSMENTKASVSKNKWGKTSHQNSARYN